MPTWIASAYRRLTLLLELLVGTIGQIQVIPRQQQALKVPFQFVIEKDRRLYRGSPGWVATKIGEDLSKVARVGIGLGKRQPHLAYRDAQAGADFQ